MKRLLLLVILLLLPSLASATTYYADPAGGGAASCVDSGANVCTIARAITVAATGDTIQAACGTYSQAGTTVTVNKNLTIAPITALCATITGTNATSIVTLTASNDANTLTFGAFDVQNTGGATSSTMLISNVAYDAVVVLSGTSVSVGGTNRFIADQYTRGTVKLIGVTLSGVIGAQAGFYSVVTPSAAKKISITGSTFTFTTTAGTTPGILIERAAGTAVSEWVYIANNTMSVTTDPGLGNNIQTIPIRLNRITNGTDLNGVTTPAIVENNTITLTATAVTATDNLGIVISSTDATAIADGGIIRGNTVTCNAPAARCLSVGTDGVTTFNAANVTISGNTVIGPYYNGSATPHGISCGKVVNCYVWGNTVRGFAAGILSSISTTSVITGNLIVGASYAPLFAKGNTSSTIANNTVIMDDAIYGAKFGGYGCLGVAVQGATNNAATSFTNNICYVKSGTGWKYTVVDTSQVANFDGNAYFSDVALTTPWSYQGTTQTTIGGWNGIATVATDLNVDPIFLSNYDFRLRPTSTLNGAGTWWGPTCKDVRGRRCFLPVDIGAYQRSSGDEVGTARTARQ